MATTTTETAKSEKKNDTVNKMNDTMTAKSVQSDDDFNSEYVIDRPSFSPENLSVRDEKNPKREIFQGLPVQGYWFAHRSLGVKEDDDGTKRELVAYFVKLTAPCTTYDREGTKIDSKEGDEIMVWETAQIKQAIPPRVANHPTHCVHMRMVPQFRAPHPNDTQKKMWTMKFFSSKKTPIISRNKIAGGASAVQQLLATLPQQIQAARNPQLGMGEGLGDEGGLPF